MVIAWSPVGSASSTVRGVVCLAGAALLAPAGIRRWRSLAGRGDLGRVRLVGMVLALALAAWALLDALLQPLLGTAPWVLSLFGWFGRGLGGLAFLAGAVTLVVFAVMDRCETRTAYAWFVAASVLSAVVTCLQVLGLDVAGTVVDGQAQGLLGNADFASAVYGIALVPSVMAALFATGVRRWLSIAAALLLVVGLAVSGPMQGPIAAVIGLILGLAVVLLLPSSQRRRAWLRGALAALMVVAGAGVAAVVIMWSQRADALASRVLLWQTALSAMTHHPLLGSGPDGFARVFGEARPEAFLDIRPPEYHASAAHDVPLQLGATLGLPGLLLWLALVGTCVVGAVSFLRRRRGIDGVAAAVLGAAVAYLAQSLVSIDMLALLVVGWALLGSVLALTGPSPPTSATPRALWGIGALMALAAGALCLPSAVAGAGASAARTSDSITSALQSAWTPCDRSPVLAQRLVALEGAKDALPLLEQAAADPRCIGMQQQLVEAALDAGDMALAQQVSADIVDVDPLNTPAWIALGIAQASQGNIEQAQASLARARQLASHDPNRYAAALKSLEKLIADQASG